jgi:hypothetical protein
VLRVADRLKDEPDLANRMKALKTVTAWRPDPDELLMR